MFKRLSEGLKQEPNMATKRATLAARFGDQLSKDQVALLTPHLTRDEITDAADHTLSTTTKAA